METNPSKMGRTDSDSSKWLENFIGISKDKPELPKCSLENKLTVTQCVHDDDNDGCGDDDEYDDYDDCNDDDVDDLDDNYMNAYNERSRVKYASRMTRMASLFVDQSRFEEICKDYKNTFVASCFRAYEFCAFKNDTVNELHERINDLQHLMTLCGSNLTSLDVKKYPFSSILPLINAYCPNLEHLSLGFKEVISQDIENAFSHLSQLKHVKIKWQCKNSTLPVALVESLGQIGKNLESLNLTCTPTRNDIFSPDILASVFPQLIALKCLEMSRFGLSQLLLQSIGEMKNLTDLTLESRWPKNHPMFDTKISMYPIGYLKNLKKLDIQSNYGVTDEFLINLCNHAKELTRLLIIGKHITDSGIMAINNLEQLEDFNLGLTLNNPRFTKNKLITDQSIQNLFNPKLTSLNLSHCIRITNKSVIKLVENLPNLRSLGVEKTKVNCEAGKELEKVCSKLVNFKYTIKNKN